MWMCKDQGHYYVYFLREYAKTKIHVAGTTLFFDFRLSACTDAERDFLIDSAALSKVTTGCVSLSTKLFFLKQAL